MVRRMISALMLLGVMLLPYAAARRQRTTSSLLCWHPGVPVISIPGFGITRDALNGAGFEIVGEYTPYADTFVDNAHVIIVTNDELKTVAGKTEHGGFAAPWRVAVTKVGDEVQVSYVNPIYIAHAYRLESDLNGVSEGLKRALGAQANLWFGKGVDRAQTAQVSLYLWYGVL